MSPKKCIHSEFLDRSKEQIDNLLGNEKLIEFSIIPLRKHIHLNRKETYSLIKSYKETTDDGKDSDPMLDAYVGSKLLKDTKNNITDKEMKSLTNSLVLHLVSIYESYFSLLIEYLIKTNHDYLDIDSSKPVYPEGYIFNINPSRIEDKKAEIISNYVRGIINSRDSKSKLLDFFQKKLDINFKELHNGYYKDLILNLDELFQRRNLITHNGAIFDDKYIKKFGNPNIKIFEYFLEEVLKKKDRKKYDRLTKISPEDKKIFELESRDINTDPLYLENSIFTLYKFISLVSSEVLFKHYNKINLDKTEKKSITEKLENNLVNHIEIIENIKDSDLLTKSIRPKFKRRIKLSHDLLAYSHKYLINYFRLKDDDRNVLYIHINYATTAKLLGKDYKKILNEKSWNNCSDFFKCMISFLDEDFSSAKKMFTKKVWSEISTDVGTLCRTFLDWPIFLWCRKCEKNFPRKIKQIFKDYPLVVDESKKNETSIESKKSFLLDRFGLKFD